MPPFAPLLVSLLLHHERVQVARSNRVARKRPAHGHSRSGFGVIHIQRKANKRVREQNTHP